MKLAIAILCLVAGSARADVPALVPYTGNGITVLVPAHWTVTVDPKQGTVTAKADPSRKDAAVMVLGGRQGPAQMSEDALVGQIATVIAKDVRIAWRGVPPGGHGRALIADGTIDGISARLAALAVSGNEGSVFGVVAAKRADFDALGGLGTLETVMGSLRRAGDSPPTLVETPIAKADLVRKWINGGDIVELRADGTYTLSHSFAVRSGACFSVSTGSELGAYESDGRTLKLEPKEASARSMLCNRRPSDQKLAVKGPRSYAISLTSEGSLVLVGPGCSSLDEANCEEHGRRELRPAQ